MRRMFPTMLVVVLFAIASLSCTDARSVFSGGDNQADITFASYDEVRAAARANEAYRCSPPAMYEAIVAIVRSVGTPENMDATAVALAETEAVARFAHLLKMYLSCDLTLCDAFSRAAVIAYTEWDPTTTPITAAYREHCHLLFADSAEPSLRKAARREATRGDGNDPFRLCLEAGMALI